MSEIYINPKEKLKIGDIFVYSWGYDQTNINFYQIISMTDKTIKIQEIKSNCTETGFMSGHSTPIKNEFLKEKPMIKKVYTYPEKTGLKGLYVSMKYGCCQLWDGKPEYTSWYA